MNVCAVGFYEQELNEVLVRNPELCGGLLELLHYHAIEMFGAWGDSTGEGGGGVELNLEKVLVHKVGQTGTYLCLSSFDFTGIFAKSIFIIFFKTVLTCLFGAQIQYLRTYSAVVLSKKMGSKIS